MADDPTSIWEREDRDSPVGPPLPAAPAAVDRPGPRLTDDPAGAAQRWATLKEAHEASQMAISTLRKWYRAGKIESRLMPGPHGPQRIVDLDEVLARAVALGRIVRPPPEAAPPAPRPTPPPSPAPPPAPGPTSSLPEGSMLVPRDTWEKILTQLGHLHQAGQELAEARERAARAETEAAFLRERLGELRIERDQLREREEAASAPRTKTLTGARSSWSEVLRGWWQRLAR